MSDRPWLFEGRPRLCEGPAPPARSPDGALPAAVLFDRDGTLVVDVPYNGDPARVEPMPTAREAVDAVRAAGIPVGVVSNQSGVARGLLTRPQVEAVQRRVEELLGPFAVWAVCPHGPDDGCGCRKPAPGLVLAACAHLGVDPAHTVVIGDIGADLTAAHGAGARAVLVPTPVTRPEETALAEGTAATAADLLTAVRLILGGNPAKAVPWHRRPRPPSAARVAAWTARPADEPSGTGADHAPTRATEPGGGDHPRGAAPDRRPGHCAPRPPASLVGGRHVTGIGHAPDPGSPRTAAPS
jgi:HAD superfamily hydrolase (TIGR01662 family)